MFFHNILTNITKYFKKGKGTDNESQTYKFNEIQQALNNLEKHQDNLEEILNLILESCFSAGDIENMSKTIEILQQLLDNDEQRVQQYQKKAVDYKNQNKIDKAKKFNQKRKNFCKKNKLIIHTIHFLENTKFQVQISKSISKLPLLYPNKEPENTNKLPDSETDDFTNSSKNNQNQQEYFENLNNLILNTEFGPSDEENISNSITNLLQILDDSDQQSQREVQKSIELKQQNNLSQAQNRLQINKILIFYSNEIIRLISILQKKLTFIQIDQNVSQLPIEYPTSSEFPEIQSDESEQQDFLDQINSQILNTKFNSKDEKILSNSIDKLRAISVFNDEIIQNEKKKISDLKKSKQIQLINGHKDLKSIFKRTNEDIKQILENIEFQLENTKQNKMTSKMIKKFSKKKLDDDDDDESDDFDQEQDQDDLMNAEIDEFNDLNSEFEKIGDMLNVNLDINDNDDDTDSDFD